MVAYQLQYAHENSREYFVTSGRIYASREEAEKALAFSKSVPQDPYSEYMVRISIEVVEILDKFEPWISEEQLARMRKEAEEMYGDYDES